MLSDSDHYGRLILNNEPVEGVAVNHSDDEDTYELDLRETSLRGLKKDYYGQRRTELPTLNLMLDWQEREIRIARFMGGQFDLLLANKPKKVFDFDTGLKYKMLMTAANLAIVLSFKDDGLTNQTLYFEVYSPDGKKLVRKQIAASTPNSKIYIADSMPFIQLENGDIATCWAETNPCRLYTGIINAANFSIKTSPIAIPPELIKPLELGFSVNTLDVVRLSDGQFMAIYDISPWLAGKQVNVYLQLFKESGQPTSPYVQVLTKSSGSANVNAVHISSEYAGIFIGLDKTYFYLYELSSGKLTSDIVNEEKVLAIQAFPVERGCMIFYTDSTGMASFMQRYQLGEEFSLPIKLPLFDNQLTKSALAPLDAGYMMLLTPSPNTGGMLGCLINAQNQIIGREFRLGEPEGRLVQTRLLPNGDVLLFADHQRIGSYERVLLSHYIEAAALKQHRLDKQPYHKQEYASIANSLPTLRTTDNKLEDKTSTGQIGYRQNSEHKTTPQVEELSTHDNLPNMPILTSSASSLHKQGFITDAFHYTYQLIASVTNVFTTQKTLETIDYQDNSHALIIHPDYLTETDHSSEGLFDEDNEEANFNNHTAPIRQPIVSSYAQQAYGHFALWRVGYEIGKGIQHWWSGEAKQEHEAQKQVELAALKRFEYLKETYKNHPYAAIYFKIVKETDILTVQEIEDSLASLPIQELKQLAKLAKLDDLTLTQILKELPQELADDIIEMAEDAYRYAQIHYLIKSYEKPKYSYYSSHNKTSFWSTSTYLSLSSNSNNLSSAKENDDYLQNSQLFRLLN